MKRVLFLFFILILLTGCRVRVLSTPEGADIVRYAPIEAAAPSDPEPPPETQTAPTEPEEADTEAPTEAAAEASTEPAEAAPEPSSAPAAQNVAARPGGASQTSGGAAVVIDAPQPETEPPEEEASVLLLTLDPNGGEGGAFTAQVVAGKPYGALPAATRRGYAFDGWWTAPDGGERILPDTPVTRTEDHTLYAHWQRGESWLVTLDGNGGRVKSYEMTLLLCVGDAYGTLPTPIREGYGFLGWFTAPDGGTQITPETVFEAAQPQTLYAHWQYDPVAYWRFTLQNRTQQIYQCQQASVYFEGVEDHTTQQSCALISDTGSLNVAAWLDGSETTDDWVNVKNPDAIVKCVPSMADAEGVRAAMQARFPGKRVFLVTPDALGSDVCGLYARLALAKALYGDWYYDVDLSTVAAELGLGSVPFS